jgi:hypothetical protein
VRWISGDGLTEEKKDRARGRDRQTQIEKREREAKAKGLVKKRAMSKARDEHTERKRQKIGGCRTQNTYICFCFEL